MLLITSMKQFLIKPNQPFNTFLLIYSIIPKYFSTLVAFRNFKNFKNYLFIQSKYKIQNTYIGQ